MLWARLAPHFVSINGFIQTLLFLLDISGQIQKLSYYSSFSSIALPLYMATTVKIHLLLQNTFFLKIKEARIS